MVIVEDKHSHPSFNTHKKHKQNWNLNLGLLKHKSTWHLAFFFLPETNQKKWSQSQQFKFLIGDQVLQQIHVPPANEFFFFTFSETV